jgi:PAS domain S-box-containing protein
MGIDEGGRQVTYTCSNIGFHLCSEGEIYRELFNNISDGIFIMDNNFRYIDVNESGCKITGYSKEELIGADFYKLSQVDNVEELYNVMDRVNAGETVLSQWKIKRKSGEYAFIEIVVKKLSNGTIHSIVRDITDKMDETRAFELEKEVKKSHKALNDALEYNKLKTEFFSNLSHELRTPLNVILGIVQLQEVSIYKNPSETLVTEKAQKYIKILKQNCYRLLRMVNNLLDITKIDSGYFSLHLKNENVISVVEDISLSVVEYAESKGIELIFDTEVEEKIMAIDEEKIERIILNLLSNALKFTPEGGKVQVMVYDKENKIAISIRDNGCGISKDRQKEIFERFIQGDSQFTSQHIGSGIGLALVRALTEIHGGNVRVKSEEGKGSEFIIELPCMNVDEKRMDGSEGHINQSKVERINIEFSDIYK